MLNGFNDDNEIQNSITYSTDCSFIPHSLIFLHDKLNMASTLTNVYMELLLKILADVNID